MKQTVIVQITESFLKVALVRGNGAFLDASACAAEPIRGLSDALITEKLVRTLKDLKVRQPLAVVSLSRNMLTVRNLHLPSQQESEIRQMVDLKLARIVPYKKEDIVFHSAMVGADDAGYTRVLLSVVKTDVVRRYAAIVEHAGCVVERVVLSSYGVWQKLKGAAAPQDPADIFLALDIDADFTDFIIFSSSALLFTRSINIGAQALIENKDGVLPKFMAELKQSLMMFYNEEMNRKPDRVLMSGARVGEALARRISAELAVDVAWVQGDLPGVPEEASDTGIARISAREDQEADFVLTEIQERKNLSRTVRELVLLGGLCVYLLTIGYGFYWGRVYYQQNYLAKVREKQAEVTRTLGDLPQKLKKVEFVKGRLEERKEVLFVIVQLQRIVPSGVAMTSVAMDDTGKVILKGQAQELADVFKFVDILENEKAFREVQTKSTKKKKVLDRDIIDFELNFILG